MLTKVYLVFASITLCSLGVAGITAGCKKKFDDLQIFRRQVNFDLADNLLKSTLTFSDDLEACKDEFTVEIFAGEEYYYYYTEDDNPDYVKEISAEEGSHYYDPETILYYTIT